jgi:hypothetical protein
MLRCFLAVGRPSLALTAAPIVGKVVPEDEVAGGGNEEAIVARSKRHHMAPTPRQELPPVVQTKQLPWTSSDRRRQSRLDLGIPVVKHPIGFLFFWGNVQLSDRVLLSV